MLFAFPTFLFALFALAIPILIHLFQLRRYKKIVFSDIRFLKQITEQNQKQRNVKEWIILAARCLALACLVFAFAKPFIPLNNKTINKNNKVVSIFVDNSFSMSQQNKEGQLLEVAKNKARDIVSYYGDNDLFQILTNDFEGKHQRLIEKKDFLLYLDEIKLSNQTKPFNKIIARQKQAFEAEANGNKIVYVISDLQQNQFQNLSNIDSSLQVNFVQIKPNISNNLSIDSAWIEQPLILPNTNTFLHVKVSNYGTNEMADIPLILKIDAVQKGIANINCKANSSAEVQIQFSLNDALFHQAELSLLDNPVIFDDKLYLTLKATGNQNIIAINANKNIQNVYAIDENYKLQTFNSNAIDYSAFSQASCIVLNEVADISSGLQTELQKYVNNGGVALIIPSANGTDLPKTNSFLQQLNAPQLTVASAQNLKVSRINDFDEVFKNVFSKIPELANWPSLSKSYAMQINSGIKGYHIATLNNDAPFIFKSRFGKGAVYLLNTPLQNDWSNFTEHALFVPFMLRLPLVNKQSAALYYNIDKPVNYSFEKNTNSKVVYLKDKKDEIAFDVNNNESKSMVAISGIKQAGNYQVFEKNNANLLANISFNLNRNESNLNIIANDSLSNSQAAIIQTNDLLKHQKEIELNYNGTQLWRWFLLAAFVFILVEVLLLKWKV
ncbi:MAG: BatA domain-containing protein [Bacteroidia bacterium]